MGHPFRNLGAPLLLSLPLFLGFLLGLCAGPGSSAVAGGLIFLVLLLIVFRRSPTGVASAAMALCGVVAAGRIHLLDPELARPFLASEVVLRGRILEVRHNDSEWSGLVEDAEISLLHGSALIRPGRVLLHVRNPNASVSFPADVLATGRMVAMRSRGNPGELPREWTALALRVQYRFFADASRTVFLPWSGEKGGLAGIFLRARERTRRWLALHAGESWGGLYLRAVATGQVPPSSHPMVILLRNTGLAHLLAISGVHVVLFFTVQAFLFRCLLWVVRRRRAVPDLFRVSSLLSLPGCLAYALMAGAPVSAIRAAGMLSVVVFLRVFLGVRGAGPAWTVLFLFTIAYAPWWIFSPSFLLSYGASFFLIVTFGGNKRTDDRTMRPLQRASGWARNTVIGSSVAFLGTLPVSAAFFERFPAGAILWNVLFVPLLGTVGVAGAFLGVAGSVFSVEAFGVPIRLAARFLSWSLSALACISGNGSWTIRLPPSGVAAPVTCFGAAVLGAYWLRSRGREPWPAPAVACAVFLAWIHLPYAALPDHRLTLAALNVGKGAAHVLSFPGGGHMLVDCGSALRGDRGETVVLPYLRRMGIRRIDVLALTHPHEDHFGGAKAILESLPVGEIWIPEGIPPAAFGEAVRERVGKVRRKSPGDRYQAGGAEVFVRGTGKTGNLRDTNERSLVLEVRHGSFSAWLPGDVERGPAAWGDVPGEEKGRTRVLFLPHHGSARAKPGAWIRAATPYALLSQNSNCFRDGNLLPSVLSFFLENGAVTLRSDGNKLSIEQDRRPNLWELLLRLPPAA